MAVELARLKDRPISQLAKELGISELCLRNWMNQADADSGRSDGLTSAERREIAELQREKRRLETENEILRGAAAYIARENLSK